MPPHCMLRNPNRLHSLRLIHNSITDLATAGLCREEACLLPNPVQHGRGWEAWLWSTCGCCKLCTSWRWLDTPTSARRDSTPETLHKPCCVASRQYVGFSQGHRPDNYIKGIKTHFGLVQSCQGVADSCLLASVVRQFQLIP